MVHNSWGYHSSHFFDYIFILSNMSRKFVLNSLAILSFSALGFAYFVKFVLGHEP